MWICPASITASYLKINLSLSRGYRQNKGRPFFFFFGRGAQSWCAKELLAKGIGGRIILEGVPQRLPYYAGFIKLRLLCGGQQVAFRLP